ncbi:MAG TPA: hypothetical protein VD998_03375 [Verrucomicrobiae bacterium]|nr:hypothetical protein [Verrucomicrobiae bacterium]
MFNRVSSFTLALVLFSVLAGSANNISIFTASLVLLMVATFIINLKRIGLSWAHLLLPMLFLLGVGSVFIVITSSTLRLVFLLGAAIAFYLLEMNLGRESHLLQNIYLLSAFALYVGIFSLEFYLQLNTTLILLLVFFVSYILSIQGFAGFSLPAKKYFYLLIAVSLTEAAWGLTYWPTHYVVNAVVIFCLFYLLWIFSFSVFFGKLTRKKIFLQLGLVTFVLLITLTSAAWRPLIG